MHLNLIFWVLFSQGLAFPSFASANVFNGDTRVVVDNHEETLLLKPIGKLHTPTGKACTATLVSRSLILTAAHCVLHPFQDEVLLGDYIFRPGYRDGESDRVARVLRFFVGTQKHGDVPNDWALLALDQNLGERVGWLQVLQTEATDLFAKRTSWVLHLFGYMEDILKSQALTRQLPCFFFETFSHVLTHNCHTSPGSSGAPMVAKLNPEQDLSIDNARIVSINVGSFNNGGKPFPTGVGFSEKTANIAIPTSVFFEQLISLYDKGF